MSFTTPDLCDQFAQHLRAAEPLFRDWGGVLSFAGQIETVRVFDDNALVRQVLESEGRGRVLVVDGGGSVRSALVGGRLAALAQQNGWSGLVVHGCIRDSAELAGTAVGVKALHAVPMQSGKAGTGQRSVPVTFAGVTFTPGAYLYADRDGMLVADRDLLRP
ncbi:MAG TPA: ribonuclease E activity regulator RraA [Gemmatimonadales bacterium]|nr:ribonuclease E activity regulator RraA [Gemmatimonadales bacterium]